MVRSFIEKLAIPGLVMVAAAGVALASGGGTVPAPAFGPQALRLEAGAAAKHADAVFDRADLNHDARLDADEYAALSVVIAELARLNGFIAVDFEDGVKTVALPTPAPQALAGPERVRVSAIASREFYLIAGDDSAISREEFIDSQLELFSEADINRNGVLTAGELQSYAARQARLTLRNA